MTDLFGRLDPRARLLAVVVAILIIASTAPGNTAPFGFYGIVVLAMIACGRAAASYLVFRCLAASPFILTAAGLLLLQGTEPEAATVAMKGYMAALLLAFLTATTSLADLLWALRRLGAPQSLNMILGMMYRYTGLLSEEYERMERARLCRTVGPLGRNRYSIFGHQLGTLVLRSWDRADRVHAAMLSRGFNGGWPVRGERRLGFGDAAFVGSVACLLLAARLYAA